MKDSEILEQAHGSEIAIIGMAARFPGAGNVEQFWRNLRDGVESVTFFSAQELVEAGIDPAVANHPDYVKAYGRLADVEMFDASFFGFTAREAAVIDPQQRFFLECAWEAFEDAGYDPERYKRPVGVYGGMGLNTYLLNIYSNPEINETVDNFLIAIVNDKDFLTTRVSYKMNLSGPSVTVQTACSTSLVAIHHAAQSLLSGACDMALAGGVTIKAQQKTGYFYQEGGIGSPDGHCRAFDAKAKGTVGGSGVGIVVLKRLEDALADGDYIYAVIKGSAINNDGSVKVGYTAPSVDGQATVIRMAQAVAEVEPETITYIETHGTGTELGDPVEMTALTQAFRHATEKKQFCAIGSVKTNFGHLDTAAGVAGVIKTVLALKHREIPPSLHYEEPNPQIDFSNSPFYVNAALTRWEANGTPRRAGVSSFGIGGTNAHAIIEEAPEVETSEKSRPAHLLLLSARTPSALENMTQNLVSHLRQHPELSLADAAYTLQVGRKAFQHRRMLVSREVAQAVEALEKRDAKSVFTAASDAKEHPVVFMFPGQGTQSVNMAVELYREEPTFRQHLDRCAELLKPHLGVDIRQIIYPDESNVENAARQLTQTVMAQPALFAVEYALAQLWMEWGVRPHAMIGHSLGEYVAACLAGVFSLEEASMLVAARGRLMQQLPRGAMLAVLLSEKEVEPLLGKRLSLAAVNAPNRCVVAGSLEDIEELEQQLTQRETAFSRLHTSHAFHSSSMDAILQPFTELVKRVKLQAPRIPYISNVSGNWIQAAEATDASYWATHLRRTVRFAEGASRLFKEPLWTLLEVGPAQTLSGLVRQHPEKRAEQAVLASLCGQREGESSLTCLLNTLGKLWLAGSEINWTGFYRHERRRRLPLPTYPFERKRFWTEAVKPRKAVEQNGSDKSAVSVVASVAADAASVVAHREAEESDALWEPILAQQLELMSRQLELLREEQLGQVSAESPHGEA
ncbi:MAG TPA: type I polyketide synthase [Pyrinomonadaceae bacterium]|nr:type I polyketide synthase [Pyrinomonadaceae bacterium]